jgi:hypothetical protein
VTVNELRDTLTKLVGLLEAADAKAATTRSLSEFIDLSAPFGELSLKAFATLAETGRAGPSTGRPKAAPRGKVDPAAVETEIKDLYARAGEVAVTVEQVKTACGRLGGLTKDALVRVAEGIEMFGAKAMKKDTLVEGITARLVDRKETAVRRTLIDRPQAVDSSVLG